MPTLCKAIQISSEMLPELNLYVKEEEDGNFSINRIPYSKWKIIHALLIDLGHEGLEKLVQTPDIEPFNSLHDVIEKILCLNLLLSVCYVSLQQELAVPSDSN